MKWNVFFLLLSEGAREYIDSKVNVVMGYVESCVEEEEGEEEEQKEEQYPSQHHQGRAQSKERKMISLTLKRKNKLTEEVMSQLKDEGLAALLLGLAVDNPGLCVVTTRESLANLHVYNDSTSPEHRLDELLAAD